mmetsp:Transcript_5411/g.17047  ORF Transcript_5411/g.17047 Transcript_5411/m.17047 type:complete len:228 (-) Transcript_5411:1937-2620(-)
MASTRLEARPPRPRAWMEAMRPPPVAVPERARRPRLWPREEPVLPALTRPGLGPPRPLRLAISSRRLLPPGGPGTTALAPPGWVILPLRMSILPEASSSLRGARQKPASWAEAAVKTRSVSLLVRRKLVGVSSRSLTTSLAPRITMTNSGLPFSQSSSSARKHRSSPSTRTQNLRCFVARRAVFVVPWHSRGPWILGFARRPRRLPDSDDDESCLTTAPTVTTGFST